MKKYLITGFLALLPITLTLMVLGWILDFFTEPFVAILEPWIKNYELSRGELFVSHDRLVLFVTRIAVLICLCLVAIILGFLGQKFFRGTIDRLLNPLFLRIPFVKSVYGISKDITKAVLSPGEKTFKKTLLIPFPNTDTHALAFLTGDSPILCQKVIADAEVSLFVPTAPHPISGYMLISSKKQVKELDISVEDAFRFLVSCGVYHPGETPRKDDPTNDSGL